MNLANVHENLQIGCKDRHIFAAQADYVCQMYLVIQEEDPSDLGGWRSQMSQLVS